MPRPRREPPRRTGGGPRKEQSPAPEWRDRITALLLSPEVRDKGLSATLAAAGIEAVASIPRRREPGAPVLALSDSRYRASHTDPLEEARSRGLPLLFVGSPPARVLRLVMDSPRVDIAFDQSNSVEIGVRARKLLHVSTPPDRDRADRTGVPALDWRTREVRVDSRIIKLTVVEMALLETLLERAGSPVTISDLSQRLRALGSKCSRAGSMVAVYTTYLRRKLQPISHLVHIRTVRRVGYCLDFIEDSTESQH